MKKKQHTISVFLMTFLILTFLSCKKKDSDNNPDSGTQVPSVSTILVSGIGKTSVTVGCGVSSEGSSNVTERGVCWSIYTTPVVTGSHQISGSGTGTFTCTITGLAPGTSYYVRAYATNEAGTGYGKEIHITTLSDTTTTRH